MGDFAGIDRSQIITIWGGAGGLLRLILSMNFLLIAGLAPGSVGLDQYGRFIVPRMGILPVVILAGLIVGLLL